MDGWLGDRVGYFTSCSLVEEGKFVEGSAKKVSRDDTICRHRSAVQHQSELFSLVILIYFFFVKFLFLISLERVGCEMMCAEAASTKQQAVAWQS